MCTVVHNGKLYALSFMKQNGGDVTELNWPWMYLAFIRPNELIKPKGNHRVVVVLNDVRVYWKASAAVFFLLNINYAL